MRVCPCSCTCSGPRTHTPARTRTRAHWRARAQSGKGVISCAELAHVLSNIGEKLSSDEIAALTKEADPEGKGVVEFDSFIRMMMAR